MVSSPPKKSFYGKRSARSEALNLALEGLTPTPVYDPKQVDAILTWSTMIHDFGLWWETVCRFFTIFAFLLEIRWMAWWDRQIWSYIGEEDIDRAQSLRRHRHGQWVTQRLLDLGPTFIKVGQSLSSRVDLFRKEYINEMARLQDRVPAFPFEQVMATLRHELGTEPETYFDTIDSQPIAAASLGQVHRVVLKGGQEAVIKVQRPNLIRRFMVDMAILKIVAATLERNLEIGRGREWRQIVDEFGRTLFEEIDYIQEGRNADRFRQNFADTEQIVIPQVFWNTTTRRVITLEYIPGTKINDIRALEAQGVDTQTLAVVLVQAYFRQLLNDGFFHADPHPGNLVVSRDGRLVFYDFGMVGHIPDETRMRIVNAFINIVNRRPQAILNNLVELKMILPWADMDELRRLIDWALETYYSVPHDQLNFEELTSEMADVIYCYPFRLPASFTFMFRAMITLEGVATTLYPQIQFMAIAVDFAQNFLGKNYIIEQLLGSNGIEGYRTLIREGLEYLGIPTSRSRTIGTQRVRLMSEEWTPLSRFTKAGFLILAINQFVLLSLLLAGANLAVYLLMPEYLMVSMLMSVFGLASSAIVTFGTLLYLPAQRKTVLFTPPSTLASGPTPYDR